MQVIASRLPCELSSARIHAVPPSRDTMNDGRGHCEILPYSRSSGLHSTPASSKCSATWFPRNERS